MQRQKSSEPKTYENCGWILGTEKANFTENQTHLRRMEEVAALPSVDALYWFFAKLQLDKVKDQNQ